jgi:RNA polymerase sigma-70 factor (ECF subfamily)
VDAATQRALVEAARTGDSRAWDELYRHVFLRLRAYVVRRCGRDMAEDLVNETMTRAVAAIDRFRWEPAGFDAWVFGIARRVTASHNRTAARARGRAYAQEPVQSTAGLPGEAIELDEDHAAVRRAFARLRPSDRELLELRFVANLSSEEVAAVLGKRVGTIRTAQSRALARLREILGDEE